MSKILKSVGISARKATEIFEEEDGSEVKRKEIKEKMKREDRRDGTKFRIDNSSLHEARVEKEQGIYGRAAESRR